MYVCVCRVCVCVVSCALRESGLNLKQHERTRNRSHRGNIHTTPRPTERPSYRTMIHDHVQIHVIISRTCAPRDRSIHAADASNPNHHSCTCAPGVYGQSRLVRGSRSIARTTSSRWPSYSSWSPSCPQQACFASRPVAAMLVLCGSGRRERSAPKVRTSRVAAPVQCTASSPHG